MSSAGLANLRTAEAVAREEFEELSPRQQALLVKAWERSDNGVNVYLPEWTKHHTRRALHARGLMVGTASRRLSAWGVLVASAGAGLRREEART